MNTKRGRLLSVESRLVVYNDGRDERFQIKNPIPFRILVGVPRASLRDTISQLLWNNYVRLVYAQNIEELFRPAPTQPDIIVAEPFALRIFFSALVVEVDRPGKGWRKGKKNGELPECNARIKKFTLEPRCAGYVDQSGIILSVALNQAER